MLIDSSKFTNFMIGIFTEKPNDVKILPTSAHLLKPRHAIDFAEESLWNFSNAIRRKILLSINVPGVVITFIMAFVSQAPPFKQYFLLHVFHFLITLFDID